MLDKTDIEHLYRPGKHHRRVARTTGGSARAFCHRRPSSHGRRSRQTARAQTPAAAGSGAPLSGSAPLLRSASSRLLALAVPQGSVDPVLREQFLMGAALGDDALVEHEDLVRIDDGRQAMRDHQRRAALRRPGRSALWISPLGEAVERRCRLVENEDRRPLQDRARDRDALLFAAGKLQAALAHLRAVAAPARCEMNPSICARPRRLRDLLLGSHPSGRSGCCSRSCR